MVIAITEVHRSLPLCPTAVHSEPDGRLSLKNIRFLGVAGMAPGWPTTRPNSSGAAISPSRANATLLAIMPTSKIEQSGLISRRFISLAQQGLIAAPMLFGLVVGQPGAIPATPRNLMFLSESLPAGSLWTAVGHSGNDLWTSTLAMTMGGNARCGFEDNPYYRPGQPAASNAQLVERLVRIARELGREPATSAEARALLHFTRTNAETRRSQPSPAAGG